MNDFRSYTNGQRGPDGAAALHPRGSGDFVNALQDAVRQNPIAAAFIGMGVLWMFMGGSNTSLFGGGARKSIFRTVRQGAEEVDRAVRDTAARVGSTIGHAANDAAGTGSQVAGGVRQASAAVAERASQTAGQAADAVASAYHATTNAASHAAGSISNATKTAAHAVQETGTKWGSTVQQNIVDIFDRQPLLLGAVGIAIGAGIAASIPTTEAEDQIMGEASDFVRGAVTEKAAQVKEMADAALHEAKAQGLTPEGAGEAVRMIGDKVGAVAQAATSINPSMKNTSRGITKPS
jgi:phage-related protein